FTVVYGPDGQARARTEELAVASVPAAPTMSPGTHRLLDQSLPIIGRQRVLEADVRLGEQQSVVLLMAPLDEVDRELGRLLGVLFMAVPVALVGSGALGYLLARKALAPMERLRRSTREITASRLDRRLAVANPPAELGRLAEPANEMIARLDQ